MPLNLRFTVFPVIILLLLVSGCSGTEKVDDSYRGAKSIKSLQLPDGLTPARGLNALAIPDIETDKSYTNESLLALEQPPQIVSSVNLQAALGEAKDKGKVENAESGQQQAPQAVGAPAIDNKPDKAAGTVASTSDAPKEPGEQTPRETLVLEAETTATPEGTKILIVKADFEKAWPVVGNALLALGFNIEDSSKGSGVYSIEKVLPVVEFEKKNPHPGDETEDIKEEFQIHLKEIDNSTQLTVHNKYGKLEGSGLADHLLLQIKNVIKGE